MALILNIETATKNCSVSLSENGQTIAVKEINEGRFSHAEKLHPFILQVFKDAGKVFGDINAVAVSKGPGSYTGLRIGVSAAKGLCYALDKPLIAVDTLKILASGIGVSQGSFIVPMLDARRMEVYSKVFDIQLNTIKDTKALIIDENSFSDLLQKGQVHFLGDGAEKCRELITHPNAVFHPGIFPSANFMGMLSFEKFKQQRFEDVAYFEPFYLKDFIAGKPKKLF